MSIDVNLHDAQAEIFLSDARFKVVAAGRRFGKSYLSAICLLIEALKDTDDKGRDLSDKRVFYVAPTFDQGKRIIWGLLHDLGKDYIQSTVQNTGIITMKNGRRIEIKGADRPDTLRGVGLSYLVMDEYAFMKPDVWEQILRPTLTDVEGRALFIGTPAGKNHFYDLFLNAEVDDEWASFSYTSVANPTLSRKELQRAKKTMTAANYAQEYEASFKSSGGLVFKEEYFQYMMQAPSDGIYVVSVDPAGFEEVKEVGAGKNVRLDNCAISVVKVGRYGWFVEDIIYGRWNPRETATKILRAAQKHKALVIGIERGSLNKALKPYMKDQMLRIGYFPSLRDLDHGNQKKTERIAWALGGPFEHGRIWFKEDAPYLKKLEEQLLDFPNPLAQDDLVDSLAYVAQLAHVGYAPDDDDEDDWDDMEMIGRDLITGY